MKLPMKERAFTTGMVILATIVVIVLAALQYRWSNQVSEATSTRLADSLQMSMINWHLDLFRDFSEICIAMRDDAEVDAHADWNQYARRFGEWKKTSAHPGLVSNLYVLSLDKASDSRALRLDLTRLGFESVAFPQNLAELRQQLRETPPRLNAPARASETEDSSSQARDREFTDRFYAGGPLEGWQFEPRIPALVRPIPRDESAGANPRNANLRGAEWIVSRSMRILFETRFFQTWRSAISVVRKDWIIRLP
jgi:hypothetical protein